MSNQFQRVQTGTVLRIMAALPLSVCHRAAASVHAVCLKQLVNKVELYNVLNVRCFYLEKAIYSQVIIITIIIVIIMKRISSYLPIA